MADIQIIDLPPVSSLEMGRAYGEAARDRIGRMIEAYRVVFAEMTSLKWSDLALLGREILPLAKEYAPDLIEEINGIAQGAGLTFDDIFLLNARSEIMFGALALGIECTSLLALPEATDSNQTILAQNWDWIPPAEQNQVVLKIPELEGRPAITTFTEAGQVGKLGLNQTGIGLAVNNLISDAPRPGVPWIFIARKVLESTGLTEAMGAVLTAKRAHSINMVIGQAGGEGVCLETAPVEAHVIWPEHGVLAHTNHYLVPLTHCRDLKESQDAYPSSYIRHRRAAQGLLKRHGRLNETGVKEILTDHYDRPFSICMHPNSKIDVAFDAKTCLSLIMNLTESRIEYCVGNPCQGEWNIME